MKKQIGYSLLDQDNKEIQIWGNSPNEFYNIPNVLYLPNGDHVHAPVVNGNYSGYTLVERWADYDPTLISLISGQSVSFDGTKIIVTYEYRNPTKEELLSYSASKRYDMETNGVIFNEYKIYTDREAQAMITGIVTLMSIKPDITINFKTANGFIQANSSIMQQIAGAVSTHIQNCFSLEATVSSQISSNTISSFAQIDELYK